MQPDVQTPVEPAHWEGRDLVITGFEEAEMVLRNSSAWSSNPENVLNPVLEFAEPGTLAANLVLKDPPEHTRLRSLFNAAFLPRVIQRLRPRVISIVDTVLDSLQDEDEADIAADVGFVVALSVMAELFDVGVEGAELCLDQPTKLLRYLEVGRTLEDFEITVQSAAELTGFLLPLIEKRRREPGEDLLSALASCEGLTTDDILSATMVMFTAGGMATGAIIANATLALLNQPDQLPALMADPAQAAEELLRMEGTSKRLTRTALVDHDICGHRIPRGRVVMVNLSAANQDLRRAPDADRMDLTRKPLPHLTLGVGPHYCLGAAITRLELTETLVRLFTRFPDLSLTDREPVWLPSTTFRWLLELPVRLR